MDTLQMFDDMHKHGYFFGKFGHLTKYSYSVRSSDDSLEGCIYPTLEAGDVVW